MVTENSSVRARVAEKLALVKCNAAGIYRPALSQVKFVGVTGSAAKSTTKELIAAVLAGKGRVHCSKTRTNEPHRVAETVLSTRPWHDFCVQELGGFRPGVLAESLAFFRPQLGVVTHVGYDHYKAFRGLEATAEEKGRLVESLPFEGCAILNVDDPLVLAMRERTRARVITYGLGPSAMVRGEAVTSRWPERLSLTAVYEDSAVPVQTRLLGEHWAHSVLAALAAGIAAGIPLQDAANAIEEVEPVFGRLSPHQVPGGVTVILDCWKAPYWAIPTSLEFMRLASATRKIVVIGTISDYPGASAAKYRAIARQALDVAGKVVFVGRWSSRALKVRADKEDDRILAFDDLYDFDQHLGKMLRAGDLVLVKGSVRTDHLERILMARTGDIDCWRRNCGRFMFCQDCRLRDDPFPLAN